MASGEIEITPGRVFSEGELVTYAKLNDITGQLIARIKQGAVTSREIADGSISSDKLDVNVEAQLGVPDGSVTTQKLVDQAVTTAKLADDNVTASKLAAGMIAQVQYAESSSMQNISAVIPFDNTVPQSGEGTQVVSKAITPSSATSKVLVRVVCPYRTNDAEENFTFAIFRGAVASAIAAVSVYAGGGTAYIEFLDSPATTSSTTYALRAGTDDSGSSFTINGDDGAARLGGASRATITLEEITQ